MMKFQGAVIKEQGVTFAVVVVKRHVLDNRSTAADVVTSFQPVFPGIPVVLMAQDYRGTPTYFGRKDIAAFLARIPLKSIPWRDYSLN
jgi:hypothetical protein